MGRRARTGFTVRFRGLCQYRGRFRWRRLPPGQREWSSPMLSPIGKSLIVALALGSVIATTSCSGQTMRDRWQQRMAERRAGGQGQQQGPMGGRRNQPVDLPAGAQVERDVAYGSAPEQRMDVYRPANAQNAP